MFRRLFPRILVFTLLLITGCSDSVNSFFSDADEDYEWTSFITAPFYAPGEKRASLRALYTSAGASLLISRGDTLRIRFFDGQNKSVESLGKVGEDYTNLGDLLTAIQSAAAEAGISLRDTIDTESGSVGLILTQGEIAQVTVENCSYAPSSAVLRTALYWEGDLTAGVNWNRGSCLRPAKADDPVLFLRDSLGRSMGLENHDTLFTAGRFGGTRIAPREHFHRIDIMQQNISMGDLLKMIRASLPADERDRCTLSVLSGVNRHLNGAVLMKIGSYNRNRDSLSVYGVGASGNSSPAVFNDCMVLQPLGTDSASYGGRDL
ncbi:MAG: hypothetical protein ACQEQV_01835 [Fibrobacterota bacterium]